MSSHIWNEYAKTVRTRAARDVRDQVWENLKSQVVEDVCAACHLPRPTDLSETEEIVALRRTYDWIHGDAPDSIGFSNWSRCDAWIKLRNAMVDLVFGRIGVKVPQEAHERHFMDVRRKAKTEGEVKKPSCLARLREAFLKWDMGEISNGAYLTAAHELAAEVEVQRTARQISSSQYDRFHEVYVENMYYVLDVPEF